uniref:Uncharacterized protein n=2 Tax=Oryza TaxID=4527 RepID=A0A0E0GGK6_ORYNI
MEGSSLVSWSGFCSCSRKAERVESKESNGEKAVSATAVMSLLLLQRGGVAVDDDEPSSEEAANCSEVCTDWPGEQHVVISVTIQ